MPPRITITSTNTEKFSWKLSGFALDVMHRFSQHGWPGNVRELQRFADHVVLGLESDGNGGRSADESKSKDLKAQVAEFETALIEDALALANGDVRATIAALNLPRKTFYDKVTRLGINLSRFK